MFSCFKRPVWGGSLLVCVCVCALSSLMFPLLNAVLKNSVLISPTRALTFLRTPGSDFLFFLSFSFRMFVCAPKPPLARVRILLFVCAHTRARPACCLCACCCCGCRRRFFVRIYTVFFLFLFLLLVTFLTAHVYVYVAAWAGTLRSTTFVCVLLNKPLKNNITPVSLRVVL